MKASTAVQPTSSSQLGDSPFRHVDLQHELLFSFPARAGCPFSAVLRVIGPRHGGHADAHAAHHLADAQGGGFQDGSLSPQRPQEGFLLLGLHRSGSAHSRPTMKRLAVHIVLAHCIGANQSAGAAEAAHAVHGDALVRIQLLKIPDMADEGPDHRLRRDVAVGERSRLDIDATSREHVGVALLLGTLEVFVQPSNALDSLPAEVGDEILFGYS
mmetsp:Transcript_109521/g.316626  ORF Transcript_109521/g.316626 Transcript_109521/m.316626 type:complete len:214 (+) Transcript_109521:2670-3311(+)